MAAPKGTRPPAAGKGRPKGALNKTTREIRDASRLLLEDAAYQQSLKRRLIRGKAPHMETLLHHYAYGKPKDTLVVDRLPALVVDRLTPEDVARRRADSDADTDRAA